MLSFGQQIPPRDIPQRPIPDPDPFTVAEAMSAGVVASGWLQKFWQGFVDVAALVTGAVITTALRLFTRGGVFMARTIASSEDRAAGAFDDLAAAAIKDLLGTDVVIGGGADMRGRDQRAKVARNIGDAVMRGLFPVATGGGGAGVKPDKAAAERFLGAVVQLRLEGWLEGWIVEALSLGALERFGDLDDALAESLGFGRLSRRVLGPPVDIFVAEPFERLMNSLYRPRLLGAGEAVRMFLRGRMTRADLFSELSQQGYSDQRIESLVSINSRNLEVGDLDYLVSRGAWTREQAIGQLTGQGYERQVADTLLTLAEDRRLDVYRRQEGAEAARAYVERQIGEDQFRRIIDTTGLPARERDALRHVAGLRRELRVRDMSLSDMEQAFRRGIVTLNEFRSYLRDLGYSAQDQTRLELLLLSDVRDEQAAAAKRAEVERQRAEAARVRAAEAAARRAAVTQQLVVRRVNLGQFEASVQLGVRTLDDYRAFLAAQGYPAEDQELLASSLASDIQVRVDGLKRREEMRRQAAVRGVSLVDMERAVARGLSTVDEYRAFLVAQGYDQGSVALLAGVLERDLVDAAAAQAAKAQALQAAQRRGVPLGDLERAVRLRLRAMEDYRAALRAAGFDAGDTELLVKLLEAEIGADDAARAAKAAAAKRAPARAIELSDLARAVRAQVRPIDDYRAALTAAGFSLTDADTLVRLLQLNLDQDKLSRATREQARVQASARNLPIQDLERAVKLGVLPFGRYAAGLKMAGFAAEAVQVLSASLAEELRLTREAQRLRAAAAAQMRPRRPSLTDWEDFIRRGLRSGFEYRAALLAEGFSGQDADDLVALLNLDLAQERAAAQLHARADASLAARQLSLSQFEQAVIAGLREMREYRAFLGAHGFSELDVSTLAALLAKRAEPKTKPAKPAG